MMWQRSIVSSSTRALSAQVSRKADALHWIFIWNLEETAAKCKIKLFSDSKQFYTHQYVYTFWQEIHFYI